MTNKCIFVNSFTQKFPKAKSLSRKTSNVALFYSMSVLLVIPNFLVLITLTINRRLFHNPIGQCVPVRHTNLSIEISRLLFESVVYKYDIS